jgi:hypothetical protein
MVESAGCIPSESPGYPIATSHKTPDRPVRVFMKLPVLVALLMVSGCIDGETEELSEVAEEVSTQNGLPAINGINIQNGLNTQNGINIQNGLNTHNGLSDGVGLMTSDAGRTTVAYLVKCALPAGRKLTKYDQYGKPYVFTGSLGVAPSWELGWCDATCQRWVSACMVAHINTAGVHIPLWLVSQQPQIGWGLNSAYPNQEGSFFGNIFTSPPQMFYCNGRNYNAGVVPGRIGSGAAAPYTNPFGPTGMCDQNCARSDYPYGTSGYKACAGWNEVVTVWR